jgi:hypothetical protein
VLAFLIVDALTVHARTGPFLAVLKAAILGLLCYLAYYPISELFGLPFHFFETITSTSQSIDFREIAFSTFMAIPVGLMVATLIYHKVLFKLAGLLHISRKISDPGVWSHIANLDPRSVDTQWVSIIDEKRGLLYLGFLQFFSDNNDPEREYFLRNVDVRRYTNHAPGRLIYQTPALYLNGSKENFKIEFPNAPYLKEPIRRLRRRNKPG